MARVGTQRNRGSGCVSGSNEHNLFSYRKNICEKREAFIRISEIIYGQVSAIHSFGKIR